MTTFLKINFPLPLGTSRVTTAPPCVCISRVSSRGERFRRGKIDSDRRIDFKALRIAHGTIRTRPSQVGARRARRLRLREPRDPKRGLFRPLRVRLASPPAAIVSFSGAMTCAFRNSLRFRRILYATGDLPLLGRSTEYCSRPSRARAPKERT